LSENHDESAGDSVRPRPYLVPLLPAAMDASNEIAYRRVPSGLGRGWLPLGDTWRTIACNWLMAHDLYHHEPDDRGELCEELATLGAEYYVCEEPLDPPGHRLSDEDSLPPPGMNCLTRSAAGIVGMLWEAGTADPQQFVFEFADCAPLPTTDAERIFEAVERSAICQLEEMLDGISDDEDWAGALREFSRPGLIASWIRKGYRSAAARFPDQARVREGWNAARQQISQLDPPLGAIVIARLRGYDASFEVREAP